MKAFLFDVDDTLYDQLQPFQRAYLKMFGEPEGVDLERLFSRSRKRGDEVFEASQLGTISMEEMYIFLLIRLWLFRLITRNFSRRSFCRKNAGPCWQT